VGVLKLPVVALLRTGLRFLHGLLRLSGKLFHGHR
jgi:hypothetical protein